MIRTREAILRSLRIGPEDIVLEIGGGNLPLRRSDLLVDRDLFTNAERTGDLILDRPFVCADGQHLPFRDKSVDYIVACQVLEHVEDPQLFLQEVSRVGKRGYIETPNELRERLIRQPFHRWVVSIENERLHIRENRLPESYGSLFRDLMRNRLYSHFYLNNYSLFNVSFEWEAEVPFSIGGSAKINIEAPSDWLETLDLDSADLGKLRGTMLTDVPGIKMAARIFWQAVARSVQRRLQRKRIRPQRRADTLLSSLLACPQCKGQVQIEWKAGRVECKSCARVFPVLDGIPVMLLAEDEIERILEQWPGKSR
jgi:uncharacterized protein YbaR (Trm112 family)/SAM-dependent methyltransferase